MDILIAIKMVKIYFNIYQKFTENEPFEVNISAKFEIPKEKNILKYWI